MKRLVLMGAGHAHLVVLKQWLREPLTDVELVLVTPSTWQYYSGMIPGWVAGHYSIDQCRIDAEALALAAGADIVLDTVEEIRADEKQVRLAGGELVDYNWLSIDIGAQTSVTSLRGYTGSVLSIKPLEQFHERWSRVQERPASEVLHCALVGGGAAGAELAMAFAHAGRTGASAAIEVSLITGHQGLLPGFRPCIRKLARRKLKRLGVHVIEQRAEAVGPLLTLTDGASMRPDLVVAVTGSEAFPLLKSSGLAVDADGFVLVNEHQQSLSHPEVFAVGDVCSRSDRALNRSGVHAIRAAPALAANLRAATNAGEFATFQPRPYTLYLISCGDRSAIGCYGPLAFSGRWVWRLKDKIDRGFVEGF